MSCCDTYVLEVIVLARDAHALLNRGRTLVWALLGANKDILELHHAGIDEEQRGVVRRHQGGTGDGAVASLFKEFKEGPAKVGSFLFGRILGAGALLAGH